MKRLEESTKRGHLLLDLPASDIASAIQETVRHMVQRGVLPREMGEDVASSLIEREADSPTAIGHATAIPHVYLEGIEEQVVFFVRLKHPVNMGAPDGIPTQFLFFLMGPPGSANVHLDTLAAIVRLMSDNEFRYEASEAESAEDISRALQNSVARSSTPSAAAAVPSAGLEYTGRLFGGVINDVKRRWQHYASDFRDGLHPKCIGSTLFLYFACLAPAVTFGGLMAQQTGGNIGAVEMIMASAVCGVIFALFSGQPLVILGGTGPLLVFTAILYVMCSQQLNIPFLPTYAWVGLWTMGFLLILAVTDAGCLMRFFTRFTDEIFSALISVIFIYEAIKSIALNFEGLEESQHHDTALLSLLLALGTFYIAMSLSRFRKSSYLLSQIREFLADFGPAIAIVAMAAVAAWLPDVDLPRLDAPETIRPTSDARTAWSVDLWSVDMWVRFAAAGPALLVTVLVYLDQNITARLVNSPDHKLHKGEAYHLDLGLVGLLIGACSLFGLPWLVAATVRSLNHVRSLATVEEVVGPNGETRDKIIHVRENRLTGLCIHLLVGVSLFMIAWLKMIPMAVLYGVFLFMGVVSMSGNQFFERLSLWLKDPALYPVTHYIRRVPRRVLHAFTLLQLVCLAVLWVVKSSALGILFPIFIALLVPVRLLANRFFKPEYLAALDAEEEPEEEETHWAA